jgi:hypothetical protein
MQEEVRHSHHQAATQIASGAVGPDVPCHHLLARMQCAHRTCASMLTRPGLHAKHPSTEGPLAVPALGASLPPMRCTPATGAPLQLDDRALSVLEVLEGSLGGVEGSLLAALDRTVTGPGRRRLRAWLCR